MKVSKQETYTISVDNYQKPLVLTLQQVHGLHDKLTDIVNENELPDDEITF